MIKIKLQTEPRDRTDIFLAQDTLEEVLRRFGIQEEEEQYLLDGTRIAASDLGKELRVLGLADSALLKRVEKTDKPKAEKKTEEPVEGEIRPGPLPNLFSNEDRLPEIVICGSAAGVFSGIRLDSWKEMLEARPDLGLYGKNGDPLFKVAVVEGPGSFNENGVVFSTIPSENGYACVTLLLDPTEDHKQDLLLERVGKALKRLMKLESGLRGRPEEGMKDMTPYSRIRTL